MSPHTYDIRLAYGLISLLAELHTSQQLPKPMFELRGLFLQRLGIDEKALHRFEREAFKSRFRLALNNMEGLIIRSEHTQNERKISIRNIHYLPLKNENQP